MVQPKYFYGCFSDLGFGVKKAFPCYLKMLPPTILSRVEKTDNIFGSAEYGSQVAPFIAITDATCKGKVVSFRLSAVFNADDMVDLKAVETIRFRDAAIFTAIAGTLCHQTAKGFGNVTAHWARR